MYWIRASLVFVVLALFVIWRAASCKAGWRPWICYQLGWLQTTLFCRLRAVNKCPFPEHGPAIIVANHTSPVDPVLLWMRHFTSFQHPRIRVIGFMMAREYYMQRGPVGWVCRAMESIPVSRSGRDMGPVKEALKRVADGHLLGLFPEGRLNDVSPDSRLLPGGTGVAWLALKAGVPVIPVFIHRAPRGKSMVSVFFQFTRTTVEYGDPVDLSEWRDKKPTHDVLADVTDRIMQSIASLGGIEITPVSKRD